MIKLLVFKEQAKKFYGTYSMFIDPTLKFLLTFISLFMINSQIGYMSILTSVPVMALISIASMLLPVSAISVITSLVIVGNMYSISMYAAAAALAIFAVMYLVFFRFTPKSGIFLLIVPLMFILKVPFVVPIVAGIVTTPVAIVPIILGTYIYFFINYVSQNSSVLVAITDPISQVKCIVLEPIKDEAFIVFAIAVVAVTIVVYIIRRLSIDYPHYIAIAAGGVLNIIIMLVGSLKFDVSSHFSTVTIIIFGIISALLAVVVDFFVLTVDYSRTEFVQYEDDDYYYYVKAVPKIKVTAPEVSIKRINARKVKKTK